MPFVPVAASDPYFFVNSSNELELKNRKLFVNQDSDEIGVDIDSEATTTTKYGLRVVTGQGAEALWVGTNTDTFAILGRHVDATTGTFKFYRNKASADTAGPVVFMENANASDDQVLLYLRTAAERSIFIDQNISGYTIDIDQDANDASDCVGLKMNIANAGAGTEYAFRFDGSEIVAAAVGGAQDKKIRVSVAGTDYFIPLHTA